MVERNEKTGKAVPKRKERKKKYCDKPNGEEKLCQWVFWFFFPKTLDITVFLFYRSFVPVAFTWARILFSWWGRERGEVRDEGGKVGDEGGKEGLGSKMETVTGCLASLLLFPPPERQSLSLGCSDSLC